MLKNYEKHDKLCYELSSSVSDLMIKYEKITLVITFLCGNNIINCT